MIQMAQPRGSRDVNPDIEVNAATAALENNRTSITVFTV
jgi:hypothetical protein